MTTLLNNLSVEFFIFVVQARHSLASNLLKDSSTLKSISDILRHTDIRTTLIYAHGDIDSQRVALNRQGSIKGEVIGLKPQ
jgi:site-specific recombinase XerD